MILGCRPSRRDGPTRRRSLRRLRTRGRRRPPGGRGHAAGRAGGARVRRAAVVRALPAGDRRAREPAPGARRVRGRRGPRDDAGDRVAVLPLRRPALPAGRLGGTAALAAAPDGRRLDVRALPAARARRAPARAGRAHPGTGGGPGVPVLPALDGAELDRLHLGRARQRGRGDLRGVVLEPARDRPLAAAGRAAVGHTRRGQRAGGARRRAAAAPAVRARSARPTVDRGLRRASPDGARAGRPRVDPAGRLLGVRGGRRRRRVAPGLR